MLASASADQSVRLWRVSWSDGGPRLKPDGVLEGHTDRVLAVAFQPTGRRLFSGASDNDRTIKIWDLDTKVEVATLRGQAGAVRDLAFDSSGVRLASASGGMHGSDNVARLWEAFEEDVTVEELARLRRDRAIAKRAQDEVWEVFQGPVASPDDAKKRIADPNNHLPQQVREFAIEHFEQLLPGPHWLVLRAESAMCKAGLPREKYKQAMVWARAVSEMAPESGMYLNAVGALQYRLGQYNPVLYKEALETLRQSNELNDGHDPVDWALLAMAYHHLGDMDEAATALEHARRLGQDSPWTEDANAQKWIREAEELVGSHPE